MCKHIHSYHYKTFIYLKCKKNHDLEKGEENQPMGVKTGTSLLWFEKLLGWNHKMMFIKIKIFLQILDKGWLLLRCWNLKYTDLF